MRKYATYYMLADNVKWVKAEARRTGDYPVHVIDRTLASYRKQIENGPSDPVGESSRLSQ